MLIKILFRLITEKLQRAREMAKPKKSSCPFCKEEKKRPLNAYLRKRSQEKNTGKICEEDDEEDQSKCCSGSHQVEPSCSKWTSGISITTTNNRLYSQHHLNVKCFIIIRFKWLDYKKMRKTNFPSSSYYRANI